MGFKSLKPSEHLKKNVKLDLRMSEIDAIREEMFDLDDKVTNLDESNITSDMID